MKILKLKHLFAPLLLGIFLSLTVRGDDAATVEIMGEITAELRENFREQSTLFEAEVKALAKANMETAKAERKLLRDSLKAAREEFKEQKAQQKDEAKRLAEEMKDLKRKVKEEQLEIQRHIRE